MQEGTVAPARAQDFERDVLPVLVKHARRRFHDDDKESLALVLCWYYWSTRKEDYSPTHFARLAVRGVLFGKDLPINPHSKRDVWNRLTNWGGAAMGGVRDRRRGALAALVAQEDVERLEAQLTARESHVFALAMEGKSGNEIAKIVGLSAGRISQIRSEVMERLAD